MDINASGLALFDQQVDDLLRRSIAEKLPVFLLVIGNPVAPYRSNEVLRRVARQGGFVKVGIAGDEMFGRGVDVREVAASAAGDPDLFADCFVAFEDGHRPAPLTRFDSAHQAGRARTDNHDVKGHTKILGH